MQTIITQYIKCKLLTKNYHANDRTCGCHTVDYRNASYYHTNCYNANNDHIKCHDTYYSN